MKYLVFLCAATFFFTGCIPKQPSPNPNGMDKENIKALSTALISMSEHVTPDEAELTARESVSYAKELGYRYGVATTPWFHNFLVNAGLKERGLCYQWATDMKRHLKALDLKTLKILWGVANNGGYFEHNTVVMSAKGVTFANSIVIDPWRSYDPLYWGKVGGDKYHWQLDAEYSK